MLSNTKAISANCSQKKRLQSEGVDAELIGRLSLTKAFIEKVQDDAESITVVGNI